MATAGAAVTSPMTNATAANVDRLTGVPHTSVAARACRTVEAAALSAPWSQLRCVFSTFTAPSR